jgi:hypothetical protein
LFCVSDLRFFSCSVHGFCFGLCPSPLSHEGTQDLSFHDFRSRFQCAWSILFEALNPLICFPVGFHDFPLTRIHCLVLRCGFRSLCRSFSVIPQFSFAAVGAGPSRFCSHACHSSSLHGLLFSFLISACRIMLVREQTVATASDFSRWSIFVLSPVS